MRRKASFVLTFIAVAVLVWCLWPRERQFIWSPLQYFLHDDDDPFGCELFDQMAAATMPNGYSYCNSNADSLLKAPGHRSLLLISQSIDWDENIGEPLEKFVRRGNKLMIVTNSMSYEKKMFFYHKKHIEMSRICYFDKDSLRQYLLGKTVADTLRWPGGKAPVCHQLITSVPISYIPTAASGASASLVRLSNHTRELSFRFHVGEGEVYVVGSPLLFSNYGVLDPDISRYLGYQLSQISDYPVVRIDDHLLNEFYGYNKNETKELSPLYYVLSRPPLRWAFYTLIAAVVLFMLFTARRRQRCIPVVEQPVNRNLEFVRLLGTLYYQRHSNSNLLSKKYTYLREELRRMLMLDIGDAENEAANLRLLAQKTGLDEAEIAQTIEMLRTLSDNKADPSDVEMRLCIDRVNEIIKHLKPQS